MTSTSSFAGPTYNLNTKNIFKYRNDNICNKWKKNDIYYGLFGLKTFQNANGNIIIHGNIKNKLYKLLNKIKIRVKYWAANPATNGSSFTGSGLPYPNEEVAFQNTSNSGIINVYDINFSLNLKAPNSYYKNMGRDLIKPQLNLMFIDGNNKPLTGVYKINLNGFYPYRTLSNPKQLNNVMKYYNPTLPIRTQAQILIDSRYPSKTRTEYPHFWGTRPPP